MTPRQLEGLKRQLKEKERKDWQELSCQGAGVKDFRDDPIGNSWIFDPSFLKSSRFIDAVKMRTNTAGVRTTLRRADPSLPLECRRCKVKMESLGHVLGECISNKPERMHRHDEIVTMVEEEA
jgi:hypothetical protein